MNKRILLIEDNPISREFLHEALVPLGMQVGAVGTLADAASLARQQTYALFLCDVHLPDGGPSEIFHSLDPARGGAKIVAITAETNQAVRQALLDLGYQEVWGKPITMKTLQDNVLQLLGINHLATAEIVEAELWDEDAALRAVGNSPATLTALRNMFLSELPLQIKTIREAFHHGQITDLKAECHKLLAGCGFVGAASLNHAVKQLSEKPDDHEHFKHLLLQAEQYLASS